jgi:hypothetical protein
VQGFMGLDITQLIACALGGTGDLVLCQISIGG